MDVYSYCKRGDAIQEGGKIVGVRWVDVQKGAGIRSRLVAQEFAANEDRNDLFAATPPLMATKACISDAASKGKSGRDDWGLMVLDVKRAFLYGDIEDVVYIDLPKEDPMHGKDLVGRLKKAMYGTRGAPHVWQKVVRRCMGNLGFRMNPIFHACTIICKRR